MLRLLRIICYVTVVIGCVWYATHAICVESTTFRSATYSTVETVTPDSNPIAFWYNVIFSIALGVLFIWQIWKEWQEWRQAESESKPDQ